MKRTVIKIDSDRCVGCGLCVGACQEGALGLVDGKAVLLRDDYCDGLGNCLPVCPTGAISFEEREALPFDKEAVIKKKEERASPCAGGGCPGSRVIDRVREKKSAAADAPGELSSELSQWPVQLQLVPVRAPFFDGADLLIAADCTAFAHGDFHRKLLQGKKLLIGCPKLDDAAYADKLADVFRDNDIRSVAVARMEVPCCSGLLRAAEEARALSGKDFPLKVYVIGTDGSMVSESWK